MIRVQIFSEMIRIRARKPELRTKSQSYSPADPPESEPNRPEKEPKSGLGASTEKPPLKPSWIHPIRMCFLCKIWGGDTRLDWHNWMRGGDAKGGLTLLKVSKVRGRASSATSNFGFGARLLCYKINIEEAFDTCQKLWQRKGGEHRRGEGSETFLERKWVLRRFPGAS